MNNITLLAGSCDDYSFLWDNFIKLCNKYWEPQCKKIIVSETLTRDIDNYEFFTTSKDLNWSDRMIAAINNIETDFIFFILDDYFLRENVSNEFILESIDFLERENCNKLIFTTIPAGIYRLSHIKDDLYKMHDDSDYLTSLQPAIWRKSFLLSCLQKNWNPWQFEIDGTNLIKNQDNKIYLKHKMESIYFNAVRKGKIMSDGWEDFYKKENLK
jgi:hypothetical protein